MLLFMDFLEFLSHFSKMDGICILLMYKIAQNSIKNTFKIHLLDHRLCQWRYSKSKACSLNKVNLNLLIFILSITCRHYWIKTPEVNHRHRLETVLIFFIIHSLGPDYYCLSPQRREEVGIGEPWGILGTRRTAWRQGPNSADWSLMWLSDGRRYPLPSGLVLPGTPCVHCLEKKGHKLVCVNSIRSTKPIIKGR